jgi:hypothetical protein
VSTIAAGELADYRDGDYEPCVANIKADGKIVHKSFSAVGDRDPTELHAAYYTPALFDPNDITPHGGRTRENARAVPELFFDVDLKDYLGLPKEALYTESNDALDAYIEALVKDITEVFGIAGIPIHRLRHSGYGVQVFTRLVREDWHRIEDAALTTKGLAQRVNAIFGRTLVDPVATGVGAQLARLPGSLNRKGTHPRPVYTIATYEGEARLDDFGVEPRAKAKVSPITTKALSSDASDEIILALDKEYAEGNRHAIALGASAMLAKAGVPREQAEGIILAVAHEDEEQENRLEALNDTYDRVEQGLSISGYMTLCNHMSPATLDYLDARLSRFAQATVTVEGVPEEEKAPEDDMLMPMPPPECFHGWFGDYRTLMAPTTEASDAYHLAAALTMAGVLIGRRAFAPLARQKHFPCLYTVLVGETGSARKDTAINSATEFFGEHPARDGRVSVPSYSTLRGLSTAEGLIQALVDRQTDLLLDVGEFKMTMLKSRKETSNTLGTVLTDLWNGLHVIDLPTRGKPLRVEEPFAALLGSITPDDLARVMTEEDIGSGFANRILFVYGEGKGRIPYPPEPDERVLRELRKEFTANLGQACKERRKYTLSPQARQVWDAHYNSLDVRSYPNDEAKKLAQRIASNALRVAVCFSVAVGDLAIEGDTMDAALKFAEWCYANTVIHARSWGANDEARLMEKILQLLRENGPQVRSSIAVLFAGRWGPSFVDKTLEAMRRMSMIASSPDDYLVAQV